MKEICTLMVKLHIIFSRMQRVNQHARPSIIQVRCPTCCYQVCALDHANGGAADLDYGSEHCHRNDSAASRERDYCLRVHRGAPSKVGDCSHPPPMAHHGFIILIYRVDRIYTFLSQFHFAEQRKMKRGEKRAMINQWCFVTMVTADEKWCWNMDVSVPAGLVLEMPWRRQIYLVYHRFLPQTHRDEVCLWPPSPMAPLRYSILEKKKRKKTRHHGDVTGASWRLN